MELFWIVRLAVGPKNHILRQAPKNAEPRMLRHIFSPPYRCENKGCIFTNVKCAKNGVSIQMCRVVSLSKLGNNFKKIRSKQGQENVFSRLCSSFGCLLSFLRLFLPLGKLPLLLLAPEKGLYLREQDSDFIRSSFRRISKLFGRSVYHRSEDPRTKFSLTLWPGWVRLILK